MSHARAPCAALSLCPVRVCPSSSARPDWSGRGRPIVDDALQASEGRPLVLVGLSAGALGAHRLGAALRDRILGLVLISGAARDADMVDRPMLVIQGSRDAMVPAAHVASATARERRREYHELERGHFILVEQADDVRALLRDWLTRHVGTP